MKKIVIFLSLIVLSVSLKATETIYFVMGVPQIIGTYNGIKLIKCVPPYENQICYSFIIKDPSLDGIIKVTCQGAQFEAKRNFSSIEGQDGITYYLELVE